MLLSPLLYRFSQRFVSAISVLFVPAIAHHLSQNRLTAEGFFNIYLIGIPFGSAGRLVAGLWLARLGDRYGRLPLAQGALLGMAVGTALMALLPMWHGDQLLGFALFFFCRFLLACCSSIMTISGALMLLEKSPEAEKTTQAGWFDTAGGCGLLLASFLGWYGRIDAASWLYGASTLLHLALFFTTFSLYEPPPSPTTTHCFPNWRSLLHATAINGFLLAHFYHLFLNNPKEAIAGGHVIWYSLYILLLLAATAIARYIHYRRFLQYATLLGLLSPLLFWSAPLFVYKCGIITLLVCGALGFYPWIQGLFQRNYRFQAMLLVRALGGPFWGEALYLFAAKQQLTYSSTVPVLAVLWLLSSIAYFCLILERRGCSGKRSTQQ